MGRSDHEVTKNKRGVEHPLSSLCHRFCLFAKGKVVADIGCAYGRVVEQALEDGATEVHACDMEQQHLDVVKMKVGENNPRLKTQCGLFPSEIHFSNNSLDAIHSSHVLEYLNGPEVEGGLAACYRWLKPGGKLFLLTYTIYMQELNNEKFTQAYNDRKAHRVKWPGYFEDYNAVCAGELDVVAENGEVAEFPSSLHVFELEVLKLALESVGFTVEQAEYLDGKANGAVDEVSHDGREYLAITAIKPQCN